MLRILCTVMCISATSSAAIERTAVDLNGAAQNGAACRLTFTVSAPVGLAALETQTVLIDKAGSVRSFSLFDFGSVPVGGLRVRQFDVPHITCGELELVLFNGVERCVAADGAACAGLAFTSRVDELEVQQ